MDEFVVDVFLVFFCFCLFCFGEGVNIVGLFVVFIGLYKVFGVVDFG